jgi:AraC family transcriptional regulator
MNTSKHFLKGLQPSPPPDHIWQDYEDYSIYSADQHRSTWNEHTHDCTQITIASNPALVRAEWQTVAGGTGTKELDGDMVWIIPPGTLHSINWNRRATLVHIYLSDVFFRDVFQDAADGISSRLSPSLLVRDPFLVELSKWLHRELEIGSANELFTKSVATLTATHLVRTYSSKPNTVTVYRGGLGPRREKRVRQYIQDHLDTQLALDDLASVAEVSPNYFISLFRQSVGMTPHRFVIQQRVERAQKLIAQTKLALIEIAHRCGFQDQSQFTTAFRRHVGVTPGQYKRQL